MALSKLDLPEPTFPTRQINSPFFTFKSIFFKSQIAESFRENPQLKLPETVTE